MSFTLGDGHDIQVILYTRGCQQILGQFDAQTDGVTWNRSLDSTSTASARFIISSGDDGTLCCEDFGNIWPWAVEMGIAWDCELIWLGPVTEVVYGPDYVDIQAADWSAIFDRRVLETDQNHEYALVTDVWEDYFTHAMNKDNSAGLYLEMEECASRVTRSVVGEDKSTAADCLEELARSAIDWYMFGRMMVVTCPENDRFRPQLTLNGSDFITPPTVRIRGNEQATCVYVKGGSPANATTSDDGDATGFTVIQGNTNTSSSPGPSNVEPDPDDPDPAPTDPVEEESSGQVFQVASNTLTNDNFEEEDPVCAKATCPDWEEFAGVLERVYDEQGVTTQVAAEEEAEFRLAEVKRPVYLELDGQLKPCAPVTWDQLRPGAIIKLSTDATCFDISDVYRLQGVTGSGSGAVSLVMQPLGASGLN